MDGARGARAERLIADAVAVSRTTQLLSGAVSCHRRASDHRYRPDRRRTATGRQHVPDGTVGRRGEAGGSAIVHRLRQRPDRAAANRAPAPRTAARPGAYSAAALDGADGRCTRARTEPAPDGKI